MKLIFFFLLFLSLSLNGQFQTNGKAYEYEPACFSFELPNTFRSGSIMRLDSIDLREDFAINARVFLGCDGDDDDGLAFIFQPLGTFVGSFQSRLGYMSIAPSLVVELDIHPDVEDGDPDFQHFALVINGRVNHQEAGTIAGPVAAMLEGDDLRDCQFHDLRIVWRAEAKELAVYFDCELRISYYADIINDIFRGKPTVFWGFTSGSPSPGNAIRICLDEYRLLNEMEDVTLCQGGETRLWAPRPGRTYRWSPPDGLDDPERRNPLARPEQTITYQVRIDDACGRTLVDELTVAVEEGRAIDLGPPDTLLCPGELLSLDAGAHEGEYLWSTGARTPSIRVGQAGAYRVTVTGPACTSTDSINVIAGDIPAFNLPVDTFFCAGDQLLLTIDPGGSRIRWEDGSTDPQRAIRRPGLYSLRLENRCGAFSASTVVEELDCGGLYIPNAFSPNGDGLNDRFTVFSDGKHYVRTFRIYDRWGALLFERKDFLPGDDAAAWDGTSRGRPVPPGPYLYDLESELPNGKRERQTGVVYLVRG